MKIDIDKIVDASGDHVTATEINRFIGIDDLYEFCNSLGKATDQLSDKKLKKTLAILNSRIKVAYFYKKLQEGNILPPISLKGNMLVDGRQRLWAYILNGDTEVEYIECQN